MNTRSRCGQALLIGGLLQASSLATPRPPVSPLQVDPEHLVAQIWEGAVTRQSRPWRTSAWQDIAPRRWSLSFSGPPHQPVRSYLDASISPLVERSYLDGGMVLRRALGLPAVGPGRWDFAAGLHLFYGPPDLERLSGREPLELVASVGLGVQF